MEWNKQEESLIFCVLKTKHHVCRYGMECVLKTKHHVCRYGMEWTTSSDKTGYLKVIQIFTSSGSYKSMDTFCKKKKPLLFKVEFIIVHLIAFYYCTTIWIIDFSNMYEVKYHHYTLIQYCLLGIYLIYDHNENQVTIKLIIYAF